MPKLILQSVKHKNSIHKFTEYDSKRKLLTAHFVDGAIYQFLDVPQKIFDDIKSLEDVKGDYIELEDNDVISDYFFGHLWESLSVKRRGATRWFDKKMRYYYVKIKAPDTSTHGLEQYK